MKITVDWNFFKNNVNKLIVEGEELIEQFDINNNYEDNKDLILIWHRKIQDEFDSSFDPSNNDFSLGIKNAFKQEENTYQTPQFQISRNFNPPKNKEQENKENNIEFEKKLKYLIKILKYYIKLLSAYDAIIFPELLQVNNRNDFTTEDILNLILEKLYILYNTNYIPVNSILNGNGIKLGRHGEERELTKLLENRGLINVMPGRDVMAQLTIQGKMLIEEKHKTVKSNYEKIDENEFEFNNTIDEILLRLEKLGYGQQIIFDEIEELKDLHIKLCKKNFGQVLKGKLVDLALSKAIENDTVSYIYNKITYEVLRLP